MDYVRRSGEVTNNPGGPDKLEGTERVLCLDAATGALQWSDKSFRCGSLILAEDKLIALSERGELIIGKATPAGFMPLLQSPVLGGRCWVQPAYSGGRIFVRNNQGDLVCVDLSTQ